MVNPKKTSKCPKCKVLKSAHDFGPPGKHCPGPDLVEDDHGSQAALLEETEPTTAKASDMDSNDLIKSLVDGRAVSSARDSRLVQVSAHSACKGSALFFFTSKKCSHR